MFCLKRRRAIDVSRVPAVPTPHGSALLRLICLWPGVSSKVNNSNQGADVGTRRGDEAAFLLGHRLGGYQPIGEVALLPGLDVPVHRQDRGERARDDKDDGHRNGICAKPPSAVRLKNEHVALVEPSQNTRLG
jgi:hypothetical protein